MINTIQNKYHATDYNFGGALTILSIVYSLGIFIIGAVVVISCVAFASSQPGMIFVSILTGVSALIVNHLWYSFARVLFEIVKNLRQTRDEIMALRNTSARVPDPTRSGGTEESVSALRYDPETHEYVKGQCL